LLKGLFSSRFDHGGKVNREPAKHQVRNDRPD
jgi:hypothetical protein